MNIREGATVRQRNQKEYNIVGKLLIYKEHQRLRCIYFNSQDLVSFRIPRSKLPLPPKCHSTINDFNHVSSEVEIATPAKMSFCVECNFHEIDLRPRYGATITKRLLLKIQQSITHNYNTITMRTGNRNNRDTLFMRN